MEATGRDGGRGASWSYRRRHEETESSSYTISSSSRSGTIVSSACTSGASRHSTFSAEEASLQLELQNDEKDAEFVQPTKKLRIETKEMLEVDKKMKHMQSLVQEFFREPSENRSIRGGGDDMGAFAVERWLKELGVGWVLYLADYPRIDDYHIRIWTRALTEIVETIRDTTSFFPYHGDGSVGMPGIISDEVEEISAERGKGKHATRLDPLQFALFVQETISKMLAFIDVMFSKPLRPTHRPPHTPLSLLSHISLHGALSKALSGFRLQFHLTPSEEVEKIEKEMLNLLSAKQDKAVEAIWSTLEKETRTRALKTMEEYSSGTETPHGSSNIHEATYLEMEHINFLLRNNCTLSPLVSEAASLGKHVPQTGLLEAPPSTSISLITGMVSCLKQELITKSKLFRDKGLMFLFLLNNSNFIWEKLKYCCVKVDVAAVTREFEHYIRSYIEVSWAPMLASLSNPAPLCLGRNHSPLSKFESEFQKTYTTQKLWKVPDPGLRKRLRKAVIEKIIPEYTRFIEDSKVTNPKFTPQELEETLQELFEG